MAYIILDLEWNGAFSKKAHGYFNEIIEIGAVKLDAQMHPVSRFGVVICPTVSRKLTKWVTGLTNITDETLRDGLSFEGAMASLEAYIGKEPATLLTWSNTDLLVLLENFRFFTGEESISFMEAYVDVQRYFQQQTGQGTAQQVSLTKACELLGIDGEDMAAHRAPDDCVLTARVLQKVYKPETFAAAVRPADAEFYGRLNFRPEVLCDLSDPRIHPSHLKFRCAACGRSLKRTGEWKRHNFAFFAPFRCRVCRADYTGRVQFKTTYDGLSVKKKLVPNPAEEPENIQTECGNNG